MEPKRIKRLVFYVLFLSVLLFQFACTETKIGPKEKALPLKMGIEVGNLAPDFNIKNLGGGRASLSDYRGKVVLVNFWATWCGPCKAEMPSMEALYRSHVRDDFEILAVSIDLGDEAPIRSFVEDFGFTFPILLDSQFDVNDLFQVRVVPTSIVIDRNGVVTDRLLGAKDWNDPDAQAFVKELVNRPYEEIGQSGLAEGDNKKG
ncbi:MAG: TlpA disulfide reductase family protein [Nitrospira sp.]|nr:TlpA family protein disulfide reductase [Candidatus Manganitrophaceae bacterium]HIL34378.1 TlpA family protein disulfide reductase [Candidatus Manganitrophaceae bacterium]